jgi:hypothetical protein
MKSRRVQVSVRTGARDSPEDDSWKQLFDADDADVMASGKTGIEGPAFEAFGMIIYYLLCSSTAREKNFG